MKINRKKFIAFGLVVLAAMSLASAVTFDREFSPAEGMVSPAESERLLGVSAGQNSGGLGFGQGNAACIGSAGCGTLSVLRLSFAMQRWMPRGRG
jgi:hypothetical protein